MKKYIRSETSFYVTPDESLDIYDNIFYYTRNGRYFRQVEGDSVNYEDNMLTL